MATLERKEAILSNQTDPLLATAAKKKGSNMPIFNLHPSPQGRLSWIRRLALRFSDDIFHQQEQYHSYMGDWRDCLYEAFDAKGLEYLCFPSLEQLMLNFRYWRLERDDWVPVSDLRLLLSWTPLTSVHLRLNHSLSNSGGSSG